MTAANQCRPGPETVAEILTRLEAALDALTETTSGRQSEAREHLQQSIHILKEYR